MNTCKDCKHWDNWDPIHRGFGNCDSEKLVCWDIARLDEPTDVAGGYDNFICGQDFGCIHWAAKG